MDPELAGEESLSLAESKFKQHEPPEKAVGRLTAIRMAVDEKVLEQFDANVALWAEMNDDKGYIVAGQQEEFAKSTDAEKLKQARK